MVTLTCVFTVQLLQDVVTSHQKAIEQGSFSILSLLTRGFPHRLSCAVEFGGHSHLCHRITGAISFSTSFET